MITYSKSPKPPPPAADMSANDDASPSLPIFNTNRTTWLPPAPPAPIVTVCAPNVKNFCNCSKGESNEILNPPAPPPPPVDLPPPPPPAIV